MLEDHDLLAERSLAALGSSPPTCLEVLSAWQELRGTEWFDDFLLRETSLSREELVRRRESYLQSVDTAKQTTQQLSSHPRWAAMRGDLERQAAETVERERRLWALTLVDALSPALRRALALSIVVNAERRWDDESYRSANRGLIESALTAIVLPLFERSAKTWRRNLKPYATFVAEAWLLAPGERPTCAAWADSGGAFAALSLPLRWFIDVWARGIALVDGCLVLDVDQRYREDDVFRAEALRWDRERDQTSKSTEAPATLTRAADGRWRLHWL